nr:MAG TPA: hypothetical protein [Caudoviricetes sp.]
MTFWFFCDTLKQGTYKGDFNYFRPMPLPLTFLVCYVVKVCI